MELKTQALGEKSPAPSRARKPAVCEEGEAFPSTRSPAHGDGEQGQLTSGDCAVLYDPKKTWC